MLHYHVCTVLLLYLFFFKEDVTWEEKKVKKVPSLSERSWEAPQPPHMAPTTLVLSGCKHSPSCYAAEDAQDPT